MTPEEGVRDGLRVLALMGVGLPAWSAGALLAPMALSLADGAHQHAKASPTEVDVAVSVLVGSAG